MALATGTPMVEIPSALAPIGQRQYHPLLSKLKRPDLVCTQGFINGKWVEAHSEEHFTVIDPATEEEIATIANMGEDDTRDAIDAAALAQREWKKSTPPNRADLLKKWATAIASNADDLAVIGSMESGKPFDGVKWEIEFVVGVIEYYSHEIVRSSGFLLSPSQPSQKVIVTKEPVGVCGIVTPWNFSYAISAMSLAPALAAGCAVVIKPASETPLSTLALAQLAQEVGFPPGVINVLTASRDKAIEVTRVLTSSKDVRKISFVGSTKVGKSLLCQSAATVKRVALRLGGNAPFIVFEDADVDQALDGLMETKFSSSGQICIASNRVFVHDSIYDEFTAKLVERVKSLKMGSPFEDGVQLGPLIGPAAVKKVSGLVEDAVQRGGKVLVGGNISELGQNFFEATVLTNVDESMRLWKEEIFGPVVPLFTFSSEEEAVQKANDTPSGLAGYFYTQDTSRIFRIASELECGMVGVNGDVVKHAGVPYGGVKESGIGREGSPEGLEEYLETKMICIGGLQ